MANEKRPESPWRCPTASRGADAPLTGSAADSTMAICKPVGEGHSSSAGTSLRILNPWPSPLTAGASNPQGSTGSCARARSLHWHHAPSDRSPEGYASLKSDADRLERLVDLSIT